MLDTAAHAFYERADASLLARAPAVVPDRSWTSSQDWEDMRAYLEGRLLQGRNWRTSWWMHWSRIAAANFPERYHWLVTPNTMTRGAPINQDVVDSTPAQAIEVAGAGMMDGLSSPTKQWFKYQVGIKGFKTDTAGQRWLDAFLARTYDVMAGSNYYDSLHQMYLDEFAFGSAPVLIYEHRERIINCVNPCAGEYYLYAAPDQTTQAFYREFTQTAVQSMTQFGPDALAGTDIATSWNNKQFETECVIAHAIEPNVPVAQPGQNASLGVVPGGWSHREYYWLRGKSSPRPLSVRGFHEKPLMSALWSVRSNDPYGRSPGMKALPDVEQLHQMTRRFAEAIDKMVRPPMLADVTLKNEPSSILPGRVTYVANLGKDSGMRPTYTVNPQVDHMAALIEKLQVRVEKWYYNDVFQVISQMEGVQPRNELELNLRQGEALMRLGPVIERNLREIANGIHRIVSIMTRRGLVPPMPPSLAGKPIEITFVSKLALIQNAAKTASMERTLAMAGKMEAVLPGTLDNVNSDRFIRDYGEKLDFPSDDWNDAGAIKKLRAQRAQAQQAAMQQHQAQNVLPAAAGAAKDLSDTDTGGGLNALQLMLGGGGMPMTGAR
jgi:hypothetical protein